MMVKKDSGFREIGHTADWALNVWAPDLPTLFQTAAGGMYSLMEISLATRPSVHRSIEVSGLDHEGLLVAFLAELLYLSESEGLGFDQFRVTLRDLTLNADISGAPIAGQNKEIKAVTYHNLHITHTPAGFSVTIVFDV